MQTTLARMSAGLLLTGCALGQNIVVQGLQLPQRLIATPAGNLLVTEGGTATPHTGRLSLVDRQGVRTSVLEGLPAARGHGVMAFGPTGLALNGRTLYLVIAQGDVLAGPPFIINPDGPASPIFDSVLRIEFTADVDRIRSPFQMTFVDQWSLSDGRDVTLRNANGEQATVHLLTTFPFVFRNILGGPETTYRYSDPYTAWLDAANNALYVVDPGAETIVRVNTTTGRAMTLTRFQPHERATPAGIQYVDNVPTSACAVGDTIFVSFLTAFPFPAGEASVTSWRPENGTWYRPVPVVRDLNMVNDIVCLRGGTAAAPRLAVVEISTDSAIRLNPPTGRVQVINGSQKRVLAANLPLPTAAIEDPATGDLLVLTLTGSILRYPMQ